MVDLASRLPNPLLAASELPPFDAIRPEQVEPAASSVLAELGAELDALEASCEPSAKGLLEPTERITDRLQRFWGTVGHLMGVQNSEALRQAHERVQPDVVRFSMRMAQSRSLFDALEQLRAGAGFAQLEGGQQRIVESLVRDARLAGVGLAGAARERFNAIQLELAQLSTQFSNHVLDATKAFALTLRERSAVEGLPQRLLELAAQAHQSASAESASAADGPWRITLDAPSFGPFQQHSPRRELRDLMFVV
jgi:oligopeptidase A